MPQLPKKLTACTCAYLVKIYWNVSLRACYRRGAMSARLKAQKKRKKKKKIGAASMLARVPPMPVTYRARAVDTKYRFLIHAGAWAQPFFSSIQDLLFPA